MSAVRFCPEPPVETLKSLKGFYFFYLIEKNIAILKINAIIKAEGRSIMSFKDLKTKAKESLKGHYGEAIKMILVYGLIAFVCGGVIRGILGAAGAKEDIIPFVSEIVTVIYTCLLGFGLESFFLKLSRNEEVTWKELFSKTNMFVSYLVISLLVGIFVTLWSLLLIIPGIIAALGYSQVYLVKLDNPEMGDFDAIKKSKELMKGHKWEFFLLGLSFIGWMILGIFTLGILYLWLIPYMSVTMCNFYNGLVSQK